MLQNLNKRGFRKGTPIKSEPTTPIKRKNTESGIVSPMKKLNLSEEEAEPQVQDTNTFVSPIKRKASASSILESPLKTLDLDEHLPQTSPETFKRPETPHSTPRGPRRGLKRFTSEELDELIMKSNSDIIIDKIDTDNEESSHDLDGPWFYKDSKMFLYIIVS